MSLTPQIPASPINSANTYLSLVDARALAEQYAYDLPVDDAEAEKALIKGFRYVESFESSMCGSRTTTIQNTSWPRKGVKIRCESFPDNVIPSELLLAQVVAASFAGQGKQISGGTNDGLQVQSKTAGKVSISYFEGSSSTGKLEIPEFDSVIKPLLCKVSGGIQLMVRKA